MTARPHISPAVYLWLVLVPVLLAQPENAPKGARPASPARPPTSNAANPGKRAPKLPNPGLIVQQLMQMTPEQRERALEKLPPQRQEQIRQRLQQFDSLPKQQQDRRLEQLRLLSSLPPETQALVRRQIQAFNQLPDDRRRVMGPELQRLRRMPASQRDARIASDQFQNNFSPDEQKILSDISANMPLPPVAPKPPSP